MKAKLISKVSTGFLIEVDDELMRVLTPSDGNKPNGELYLHSYVRDAEQYSYALKRKKMSEEIILSADKAHCLLISLSTLLRESRTPGGPQVDCIKMRFDKDTITLIPICKQIEITR